MLELVVVHITTTSTIYTSTTSVGSKHGFQHYALELN